MRVVSINVLSARGALLTELLLSAAVDGDDFFLDDYIQFWLKMLLFSRASSLCNIVTLFFIAVGGFLALNFAGCVLVEWRRRLAFVG